VQPHRPDPDELLQKINDDLKSSQRGKLKVFFGYSAGVGKTYAMLQAARKAKIEGREVVVGYVEPHGRQETEALLDGFETIATRTFEHRGIDLNEFDVDAALQRKPDLLLVDELAHTNAIGSRHGKRWQDVIDLLDAGINVWTTLNVQHLESLNDVIGQITGVAVRETVPDQILQQADDLELVDISPEALLSRLKDGKVYISSQAERALQSFFQRANLVALRELSLRQTAQRVHTDVELARREHSTQRPWATNDKLLVCIGASPTTARVIRTAKRIATAIDCPWIAVCVERAGVETQGTAIEQIAKNLRLAERLGAETITLTGSNVAETLLDYAKQWNVTKIFIGKTKQPRWKRFVSGSIVDDLMERSGEIDVYVIQGEEEKHATLQSNKRSTSSSSESKHIATTTTWINYGWAAIILGFASLIAWWLSIAGTTESNIVMTFLAAVALVAYKLGRGPAVVTSVLSVLIFDVAFVLPYGSITVDDSQYLLTFAIMLSIGLLISALTSRLQSQVDFGKEREKRTLSLNRLGKQLAGIAGDTFLVAAAGKHLAEMIGGEVAIYLASDQPTDSPRVAYGETTLIASHAVSGPASHWVIQHEQVAGKGTDTLPNAIAVFFPIASTSGGLGAIAIATEATESLLQSGQRQWLENCANQLALALERDRLSVAAADARVQTETEKLRSTLLSGVSHDLKTPLTAIAGVSSTLLSDNQSRTQSERDMLITINDEATRLNSLIDNVLQISKIDAGVIKPSLQWHLIDEVIGTAIQHTKRLLREHHISTNIPADLPLIRMDDILIGQVMINLLENASKYTPPQSRISINVKCETMKLHVCVRDSGPGITTGTEEKIFERFYRRGASDEVRGSGLGLAICKAIIELHQGRIIARNNADDGGAEFCFTLPMNETPPTVNLS
jgi:two-component system, OmpR family, sensor histidine kinase KdpD